MIWDYNDRIFNIKFLKGDSTIAIIEKPNLTAYKVVATTWRTGFFPV